MKLLSFKNKKKVILILAGLGKSCKWLSFHYYEELEPKITEFVFLCPGVQHI